MVRLIGIKKISKFKSRPSWNEEDFYKEIVK